MHLVRPDLGYFQYIPTVYYNCIKLYKINFTIGSLFVIFDMYDDVRHAEKEGEYCRLHQ